ncbi:MAG: RnfABCDGE type electron transport complex subunit B [Lachnospiraceae bacterium]|nr:RnfABCDGE type electron transport complex subunit B [Lachnospiraceae bacterium]
MDTIFMAVFSVTAIGVACAVLLCISSKVMYVKADERVTALKSSLPGSNCGACGYPGCAGYAEALVKDPAIKTNLCTPGGASVAGELSRIMGVESGTVLKKLAVVRCLGDSEAQQVKMDYAGIKTCYAATEIFGGQGACTYGCLGYGDCKNVCPSDAICIENNLAKVNANCIGCGICVKVCPNQIITIEENLAVPIVLCQNHEKGGVVRKKCSKGCLACTKCVRECPESAITMEENLAVINPEKCTNCGHCAEICMTKCIGGIA